MNFERLRVKRRVKQTQKNKRMRRQPVADAVTCMAMHKSLSYRVYERHKFVHCLLCSVQVSSIAKTLSSHWLVSNIYNIESKSKQRFKGCETIDRPIVITVQQHSKQRLKSQSSASTVRQQTSNQSQQHMCNHRQQQQSLFYHPGAVSRLSHCTPCRSHTMPRSLHTSVTTEEFLTSSTYHFLQIK